MAEWLKATDCKSVDDCLRRFESFSAQFPFLYFFLAKMGSDGQKWLEIDA